MMIDLFDSYSLGDLALPNRIVMPPLTRSRAPDDVADDMTATYYRQRATAGLIISEGIPISREGRGYLYIPGISTAEQIAGWLKTTDAVHEAGGKIFAQLWHVGRVSHTSIQKEGVAPVSASSKVARGARAFGYDEEGNPGFLDTSTPRQLATDEIGRVVEDFVIAAQNALGAGFDGVELHGASGYLIEQFLNPNVNDRNDRYSSQPLANRLRFTLEVIDAVSAQIGAKRVGIRFTPYGQLFDMPAYADTESTYLELGRELAKRQIAYIHLMDQSGFRLEDMVLAENTHFKRTLEKMREVFDTGALILAGAQTLDSANQLLEAGLVDLVGFGQAFIANPDLVARFRNGWPLNEPDRATYYGGDAKGYIDYPTYVETTA